MKMSEIKFAVVRLQEQKPYVFNKWHDSLESAKAEAERLARQYGSSFAVIQTVGVMHPSAPPVEWTPCTEAAQGRFTDNDF